MPTNQREELLYQSSQLYTHPARFEALALEVFRFQCQNNPLYGRFVQLLRRVPEQVTSVEDIPFLPISFFKTHTVQTGDWNPNAIFTSSGTTGQVPSRHFVRDPQAYLDNCVRGFEQYYGRPEDWLVLALLPAYLERTGSSLVAMADDFIQRSRYGQSGFFLHNHAQLAQVLQNRPTGVPTLLLGVSFALLDFAEQYPIDLQGVTIMETGGMKGRRKEMTRAALHETLCAAFKVDRIHSEYGMTELFSQGYAQGGTVFAPASTLKVVITETNDPFCVAKMGRPGQINLIDLANIDSCAFIATEDLGKMHPNGRFEVLGRLDTAELRGCNLMVE